MRIILSLAVSLLVSTTTMAQTEVGISADKILIGTSTTATNAKASETNRGSNLYFAQVNEAGGVNGRKFEVITLEDDYKPEKTLENAMRLVEKDKVFALFGFFGAPTGKAVTPYVMKTGIPYFAPYSGVESLRSPVAKNVFNVRLTYASEMAPVVRYLVQERKIKEIGVFFQDDSLGHEGKSGVQKELAKLGLALLGEASYKRDTTEVVAGIERLKKQGVKAVILCGTGKMGLEFIKKANEAKISWIYGGSTPLAITPLIKEPGAEGTIIAQGFPSLDSELPINKEFKAAVAKAGIKEPVHIEGYISAKILVEAVKRAGKNLTRESFFTTLEAMKDYDIGGLKLNFSPTDHQGLDDSFLTIVKGGKLIDLK